MVFDKTFGPALALVLLGPLASTPAAGQGQWMDIGSGLPYTILMETESRSFERFPPFAFGQWDSGLFYIYAELLPWPCAALPAPDFCGSDRFVSGFFANLEFPDRGCPCSGVLIQPVELELHYDPAVVAGLGRREEDLRIARFDDVSGHWIELANQRVVAERDVVDGSHLGDARQFFALIAGSSTPVGPTTWGRIKAQWAHP